MATAKPRPDLSAALATLRQFDLLERAQLIELSADGVSVRLGPTSSPPQHEDPRRREAAEKAELDELLYASSGG